MILFSRTCIFFTLSLSVILYSWRNWFWYDYDYLQSKYPCTKATNMFLKTSLLKCLLELRVELGHHDWFHSLWDMACMCILSCSLVS